MTEPTKVATTRAEALGWMHAELCASLDKGNDPRQLDVAELMQRADVELEGD